MKTAEERNQEALDYMNRDPVLDHEISLRFTALRSILKPEPIRHTFGGVVFEETGEVEMPEEGTWLIHPEDRTLCIQDESQYYDGTYTILRPVAIEEVKDEQHS